MSFMWFNISRSFSILESLVVRRVTTHSVAELPQVLRKLHNGHSTHTGKIPVSFNEIYAVKKKIEEIRVKMKEASRSGAF